MRSREVSIACAILLSAAAQAATVNTTLTVTNATGSVGLTGVTVNGPAVLTGIGSGTFSATASLTSISGTSATAPFTITLSAGAGTLTGNLTIPVTLLTGSATTGTGSATVTGGTGGFAGATGSFPNLTGAGSGSITAGVTLSFSGNGTITTGGAAGPPAPTITAILDAAAYTASIAQGSIFVVKGTNLSATGFSETSFPLPTSSGGVKITFTPASGGAGTDAFLVYLYNQSGVNQLAAILPSSVAPGNYNVIVTNNNGVASAAFATKVVLSKPGLITQNSAGTGLGVIQNYVSASELDIDRFTVGSVGGIQISPARPGQTEIAWFTGLGAAPGGDNVASPGYNFPDHGVVVQVLVGGMTITPGYAGRTPGLAGTDQINFTLPANVPTGCTVSFQLSVNGVLSNLGFIAIAPDATSSACVQPGYTPAQLQNFDNGGTFTAGTFAITQISETVAQFGTIKIDAAAGSFTKYTGFDLASIPPSTATLLQQGSCYVTQITGTQGQTVSVGGTNLDAGKVTLDGPSGSNIAALAFTETNNAYSLQIGEEGLPAGIPGVGGNGTIVAGTYKLTGAGGADVSAFSASVTLGSPLTVTGGLPTTVNRSSNLTLNWTGGNSSDIVEISGISATLTGTGTSAVETGAQFVCFATAGQGTFTVPSSILLQLPAVSSSASTSGTGIGELLVFSGVNPTTGNGLFSAPLTAGGSINNALFVGYVGTGATVSYQ